jgi:aquaporin Z
MVSSLKQNWKIYSMEAICLGLFMVSASFFGTILEYPSSTLHLAIQNDFARLVLMGAAMGTTATLIIYSPMGKLSGAHMNPAVSFTFVRLGKMKWQDGIFYTLFQCLGGVIAVYIMVLVLGEGFTSNPVNYVVTTPGKFGARVAFIVEIAIAFCMMMMVLVTSNNSRLSKYTGLFAGFFVMTYVIVSGPISGFGMNPARSLASAIPAMQFPSFWIYVLAPFIGMLTAAEFYKRVSGAVLCAKMHHSTFYKCIFDCGYCEHNLTLNPSPKGEGLTKPGKIIE